MAEVPIQLPHGAGFRFVDRVRALTPGARGTFEVTFARTHPILAAHFPGNPLVPAVLLIEALAQAAGCVWGAAEPGGLGGAWIAEVGRARFRAPVPPDRTVVLTVAVTRRFGRLCRFAGTAEVDGTLAAEVELTLARETE